MARVLPHTFDFEELTSGYPPAVVAQARDGVVHILGGISITGVAGALESLVTRHYRSLTLGVVCHPDARGERRVLDFRYEVRVPDLEPGRYLLRVRHSVVMPLSNGRSESASFTVYEGEVRIKAGAPLLAEGSSA